MKKAYRRKQKQYTSMADLDKVKTGSGKSTLLERIMLIEGLACLVVALFFLSNNMTGFAVANVTQQNSSIIGVMFFILGAIASFFLLSKKV